MLEALYRRFSILAMLLVLLTSGAIVPAMAARPHAAAAPSTNDGVSMVMRLITLVKNEYREEVPQSKLIGGAIKGMRDYLKKNGMSPAVAPDNKTDDAADLRKAYGLVVQRYPKISQQQLTYAAIRGMLESLDDPYTVFLDPEEYKGLMGQLNGGNFGGLGIYIESDEKNAKALTIVEPMEGTPATEAGLRKKDVIVEIDGKSTLGMKLDDATKLLRGPVGSAVVLTIKRGADSPFKVSITRRQIHVPTLTYKVLPSGIGLVSLKVFGDNANEELEEAFRAFDKAHVKAYILDLRNNGGGYITAALDVSSHFLPTGSRVVSVAERGAPEMVYNSRPNLREVLPVVVLVNGYSASASEITAGAVKDLKAGTLIGEKTFGKGSVQKIFPLPGDCAVKITTAHYHTPSGADIHKKGIVPDVVVAEPKAGVSEENDPQMIAAVTLLRQKIAQREQGIAQNASSDVTTGHADAVRIGSSDEEFEYVAKLKASDGSGYRIVNQTLVSEGDRRYDVVDLQSENSGQKKTIWFQLDYFRAK